MNQIAVLFTRNAAEWLADAVRRLKGAGWIVIVLDNGSADDTAEVARQNGAEVLRFSRPQPAARLWRKAFAYAKTAHPHAQRCIVIAGRAAKEALLYRVATPGNWLKMYAPFWEWPAIIAGFSRAYVQPKHVLLFAKDAVPAILAIGFAVSIFIEINRSLDDVRPPVLRAGESGIVAQERRKALEWLARHSPEDAVVMADQFDGNYIVALAGRRVVSSSKVYPSEAQEVSARYTDISKFFFATDEESALAIAAKYDAEYVFVTTEFSYAKNCRLANACQFIASGELTPVGRKMTLIGKMLNRERFTNFELVWDSPYFSIFRIKNDRTLRNPCRLTRDEELTSLKIARGAPDVLGRECSVAVSAYRNGGPRNVPQGLIRGGRSGPVVVVGKPLGQAIREAANEILSDTGLGAQIQMTVWSDEELVRRDIESFLKWGFDVTKVLVMERQGKRAVFLPEELNLRLWNSNTEILDALCGKLGSPADCWRTDTKIFIAPVTIFADDGKGGVLAVSGTLPIAPDVEQFDDRVLRERLLAGRNWIWRMRTDTGDFRNEIDPHNPAETPDDTRLATLHGAAETWWLLDFYRAVPDLPAVIPFGRAQSDRFERLINSGEEERTAFLIYAGLENLSLWRITKEAKYLERAVRYADIVRRLFIDTANLARSFRVQKGVPEIVSSKSVGTIGNNSGLYFLAETLREKENPLVRDAMRTFADALKYNFRKNRILDPDISIVWESWLVNAFASVSEVTQNRRDAEFALEVANWILDYQSRDAYPHLRGAFRGRAATSGVGKITEALVEAAILAPKIGEDPAPYLEGFREAMRWLMSVQYSDTSYFLSAANRREMAGALRSSVTDITAEIDNAGHMVIAGAWYLSRITP